MDFKDLIQHRYSVREYASDPVDEELLRQVLEAGRLAPTAANRQAFRLVVIRTAGREEELKRLYPKEWFVNAPVIIGVCGIPSENWVRKDGRNYCDVDGAIVMDHIILQAADLGLGTCWIGAFDPDIARELLRLPEGVEPIAFTPLGHPADTPRPKRRKSLEDLISYERW
jgi:nitroreductase